MDAAATAEYSAMPHADPIADAAANAVGLFPPSCSTTGYSVVIGIEFVVEVNDDDDDDIVADDNDDDDVAKSW